MLRKGGGRETVGGCGGSNRQLGLIDHPDVRHGNCLCDSATRRPISDSRSLLASRAGWRIGTVSFSRAHRKSKSAENLTLGVWIIYPSRDGASRSRANAAAFFLSSLQEGNVGGPFRLYKWLLRSFGLASFYSYFKPDNFLCFRSLCAG